MLYEIMYLAPAEFVEDTGLGIQDSTVAGIITALATVITAIGGVIVAIGILVPILRNGRETMAQVQNVHTVVNQQQIDSQRYIIALTETLRQQGIDAPVDQSKPVTGYADAQPGQPKISSKEVF